MNSIVDFFPMPPDMGPPLPRFLGIVWPWVGSSQQGLALPSLPFVTNVEASYENEEEWSWVDWKGRERKITVTRKAKVR